MAYSYWKAFWMLLKPRSSVLLLLLIGCSSVVGSLAQPGESHQFSSLNLVVPDGNPAGLADVQWIVSSLDSASSLRVKLKVSGDFNGDLYGYLHHNGRLCVLINRVGRTGMFPGGYSDFGFDVAFDDGAANGDIHLYRERSSPDFGGPVTGVWQPDGRGVDPDVVLDTSPRTSALAVFNGVNPNGPWTLFLADMELGGTNVLAGWELEFGGVLPYQPPLDKLELWLRADQGVVTSSGQVTQWNDQSGRGRHAIQSAVASRPMLSNATLNGQPVVRFDGLNDFLTFTLPVNGLNGLTLVMVAANHEPQTVGSSQAERAALFWNQTTSWGTVYLSPFQQSVAFRFGTTQVGNRVVYPRPSSVGNSLSLSTAIKNGTTDLLYINHQLVISQGGKLATIAGCLDTGNLGRGYNDNTFFAGDIAEVLVYTRALTDLERQSVEGYLNARYQPAAPSSPQISTQPADLVVVEPSPALFQVTATGTQPLAYQWRRDGNDIPGANGSSYQLSSTALNDNGAQFAVVISNAGGAITSRLATLTVSAPVNGAGSRVAAGLVALYDFAEGTGTAVHDVSGVGDPLNLSILDPARVQWLGNGAQGVRFIGAGSGIRSTGGANKIHAALVASGRLTLEAWLTPANLSQSGPARIVTISEGSAASQMNLHLGQGGASGSGGAASFRLRTSGTSFSWLQANGVFDSAGSRHHVAVTYDGAIQRVYVDGILHGTMQALTGGLAPWNATYPLVLGNEASLDRSWLGTLLLVAVYDRALSLAEVQQNYEAGPSVSTGPEPLRITGQPAGMSVVEPNGAQFSVTAFGTAPLSYQWRRNGVPISGAINSTFALTSTSRAADHGAVFDVIVSDHISSVTSEPAALTVHSPSSRVTTGLVALYDFAEGTGSTVHDVSGVGAPLELNILDPARVQWLGGGTNGLRFASAGSGVRSPGAAGKIHNALTASGRTTLEVWLTPASLAQSGPSRIVTLSGGTATTQMNLHLGQGGASGSGDAASFRLRTSGNSFSWMQAGGVFTGTTRLRHLMMTFDGTTQRIYVDGAPQQTLQAPGNFSNWDAAYPLVLGNESTLDRSWLGSLYLVAIYSRTLSLAEVQQNFHAGPQPVHGLVSPALATLAAARLVGDAASGALDLRLRVQSHGSGAVRILVAGPARATFVLERSFDLADWTSVATQTLSEQGQASCTETLEASVPSCFFRIRLE